MKNKKDLMTRLSIAGAMFGYFFQSYFPIWIRLLFAIFASVAVIVYVVEGKKNNYSKISIIISKLGLMLFITIFINDLVIYKYPEFLGYQGFIMALTAILIFIMMIIGGVNYINISNKREGFIAKILLSFIILMIVIVIIGIVLKKYGVIP